MLSHFPLSLTEGGHCARWAFLSNLFDRNEDAWILLTWLGRSAQRMSTVTLHLSASVAYVVTIFHIRLGCRWRPFSTAFYRRTVKAT